MASKTPKTHFGNIIMEILQKKGLTVAWLAKQVNCDGSNFSKKLKDNNIDRYLLFRISDVLHVDFFKHYSEELSEQWKTKNEHSENLILSN